MEPRLDPKRPIICSPLKDKASKKAKVNPVGGGEINNVIEIDSASSAGVEIDNAMASGSPPDWFCAFFEKFEARFEQKIDTLLCKRLEELTTKVNDHEDKICGLQMEVEDLHKELINLRKEEKSLTLLVDDLENRSRRNNLVFHGIPEAEGSGVGRHEDCNKTITEVLQFVGLLPSDYSIERVHRTPSAPFAPPSNSSQDSRPPRPRIMHVCFTSFKQKELVRTACVKKFQAEKFHGQKLFIADDLSKRIRSLRKNKMEDFKKLRLEGKKPFFLYPDKLAFRDQSSGRLRIV